MKSQDPYLANTELIEKAIRFACRRHHLYAADAQDFASVARLHLIDRDYAVLRAFKGQSSLQTYLVTVLTRCFLDWRNSRWGKWRNSAEARRMGPMAVHLETLINRDGYSFEEAYQTLRSRHGLSESPEALQAIAARLPRRTRRSFTSDGALDATAAPDGQADAVVVQEEAADAARVAAGILDERMRGLLPQDRLILKMRFHDDFAVADIARALGLEQKSLYRKVGRLLDALREALESKGITATIAADVLDQKAFDLLHGDEADRETGERVRPFYKKYGRPPVQDTRVP